MSRSHVMLTRSRLAMERERAIPDLRVSYDVTAIIDVAKIIRNICIFVLAFLL